MGLFWDHCCFSFFINDIDKGIVSKLLKFADDTKLVVTVSSEAELEQILSDCTSGQSTGKCYLTRISVRLVTGRFAPWMFCPFTGHFATRTFHPLDVSPPGRFAPGLSPPGRFAPGRFAHSHVNSLTVNSLTRQLADSRFTGHSTE